MNIFEFAMKMEKDGENYYRDAAARVENKGIKTILNMLAEDEVRHYHIIEQLKDQLPAIEGTEILTKAKNVFLSMKEQGGSFDFGTSQLALYEKARELEKESREFYKKQGESVEDPQQKALFEKLADEENKHYFLLYNIIEAILRPQTWVENGEFYHLEAY